MKHNEGETVQAGGGRWRRRGVEKGMRDGEQEEGVERRSPGSGRNQ